MTRLIVISGPEKSGKMPLARAIMDRNHGMVLISRDRLRDAIVAPLDEFHMTHCMAAFARAVLAAGVDAVVHAWNLEPMDREIWQRIAAEARASLVWLDTREAEVQQMIPALDDPRREAWGVA
jgi:predicted kinase